MASEKSASPRGTDSTDPFSNPVTAPTTDTTGNNNETAVDAVTVNKEAVAVEFDEENMLKDEELANPEDQIDALCIPNWSDLEKKLVMRLGMTLMPCLWVLYLFSYLDCASIA